MIWGINHVSMCRLNLNFKILGEIQVGNNGEGVNHLSLSRLNLNFKILGEILVDNTGGPSSFALVHHLNLRIISEVLLRGEEVGGENPLSIRVIKFRSSWDHMLIHKKNGYNSRSLHDTKISVLCKPVYSAIVQTTILFTNGLFMIYL